MDEKLNYNEYEFLKRSLQFVFLIFVFCLCAWLSRLTFNANYYYYFSTCFLSMVANTLERKYMFLICNLILVFLVNTFDDLEDHHHSPPSSSPSNDIYNYTKMRATPILVEDFEEEVQHEPAAVSEAEAEEHGTLQVTPAEAPPIQEEEEEEEAVENDDEEEDEDEDENELEVVVKGDEEVGDKRMATNYELELASTEELNRKFEEFIRKMKEEIRIEPQRHPIVV